MSTWRYVQNGAACGPVAQEELQSLITRGTIPLNSYVWKEGMSTWVAANTLTEFASCSATPAPTPPAFTAPPGTSTAPPPPPPTAAGTDAEDIEKNRAFAILAYLWILFIIPLLVAPGSKFAKYHANQGLVLFLGSIIGMFGSMVLAMIPLVNLLGLILIPLLWLSWVILLILGVANAAAGSCKPLPVIGGIRLIS